MKTNKPVIMAAHARKEGNHTVIQFTSANLNIPIWIKTRKVKK